MAKTKIRNGYKKSDRAKYDWIEASRIVGDWAIHRTYYCRSGFQITHIPSGYKTYPHCAIGNEHVVLTFNRAYSIACKLNKMKAMWSGRGVPSERFLKEALLILKAESKKDDKD